MTDLSEPAIPSEPLDELISELLAVGAVLSQIVAHMVRFKAQGQSAPHAAPIPEAAHALLRDVLGDLRKRHSKRDIRVAASIAAEATEAICNDVFLVDSLSDLN